MRRKVWVLAMLACPSGQAARGFGPALRALRALARPCAARHRRGRDPDIFREKMKGKPVKLIKTTLRGTIEFMIVLAILLGAAIAPGLLNASSSTIVLFPHTHQTETTP
ncbi:MAG: hypothetical protein PHT60_14095 [Acidiphilium sp.]|nr:hypothetical protein [Acidiphilium sp.]MDD4936897.1 hypothetical protein [Acidiphilium sp.]